MDSSGQDQRESIASLLRSHPQPGEVCLTFVRELIAQATEPQLSFLCRVAQTIPALSNLTSVSMAAARAPAPAPRMEAARGPSPGLALGLVDSALRKALPSACVASIFRMLPLPDHLRLARCCRQLFSDSRVPRPARWFARDVAWAKEVVLGRPRLC